ncbi:MAG: hypothetical protein QOE70_2867 [Chthoniobacter sp.]|jgi:hypothetical protein|nr:hypothetical protein [Chthoniobacter sp.]
MKKTLFSRALLLAVASGCVAGSGWSEESPAAKTGGATPADFEKATEAIPAAMRAVFATIEAETAAGHLDKKEAAAELRRADDLRYVTTDAKPGRWSVEQAVQKILEKPPKNAAILQAWNDLNARLQAYDALYVKKYPVMVAEAMQTAANLWRTAQDPDEVKPTIQYLKTLESLHWPWVGLDRTQINTPSLTPLAQHLEFFAALLAAEKMGDPEMLTKAAASLHVNESPFGDFVSVKEINDRRDRVIEGTKRAAWEEMLATLPKAAEPDDLIPIADKLAKVALATAHDNSPAHAQDYSRYYSAKEMAMGWREMLRHELAGEWEEAARTAVELSHKAEKLAPTLVAPLQAHLAVEQKQATQSGKERHEELVRKVRQTLEAVTSLSGLREAINDPEFAVDQAGSGDARDLRALRDHLRWLYGVWAMAEIDMTPSPALLANGTSFHHSWTTQTGRIWSTIHGQIIARALKIADPMKAPGNAPPTSDLGRDLVSAAEARHDWYQAFCLLRRLNALDPAIAAGEPSTPGGAENERLDSMRSLLAGDNFAKAELWPDAIRSYKTALHFLGDSLLSADVGDRLKSLKSQHPELF